MQPAAAAGLLVGGQPVHPLRVGVVALLGDRSKLASAVPTWSATVVMIAKTISPLGIQDDHLSYMMTTRPPPISGQSGHNKCHSVYQVVMACTKSAVDRASSRIPARQ